MTTVIITLKDEEDDKINIKFEFEPVLEDDSNACRTAVDILSFLKELKNKEEYTEDEDDEI